MEKKKRQTNSMTESMFQDKLETWNIPNIYGEDLKITLGEG